VPACGDHCKGKNCRNGYPELDPSAPRSREDLLGSERTGKHSKGKIKEIEGVLRVDSSRLDGDEAFSFSVETELKTDVRGRIARKVVESGYDLLELRSMSMSLEDVFLQLTTKEEGVRGQ
jgi:ABC-2 type transport system ATP-binding protein